MSFFPQTGGPGLTSPRLTSLVNNLLPAPLKDAANRVSGVQDVVQSAMENPVGAIGKVGDLVGGDAGRTIGAIGDAIQNPRAAIENFLGSTGPAGGSPQSVGRAPVDGGGSLPAPVTPPFSPTGGSTAQPPLVSGAGSPGFVNPGSTGAPSATGGAPSFANPGSTGAPAATGGAPGFANPGSTGAPATTGGAPGFANPGSTGAPAATSGGAILPYSPGGMTPGMGPPANTGVAPGGGAAAGPYSPGPGGAPGPGYGGGPSPSPTYPDVGSGLVRRAGPFGNQIGLGTLGDYFYNAAGGDRGLNRNELMGTLGVSSPIADTLIARLGNGMTVPVEALIETFRPYSFDGVHISDQGIDMALRETMGPVQANFFSFADPNGNLSMAGFAAIAREAMHFLGMPQPNPAMLSAAFRRLAGMDGMLDISEAGAMLGIGPDGSFSLGDAGMAIMNLLSTAPTPGGFAPPWGPPVGGPPPYMPGPRYPFGPTMPVAPGPAMWPGQFHAMVNDSSRWTGQYFHPAQIDAAYRNIGMMDGYPGISPWEAGMAFGSSAPSPFQVASGVAAHSWPSYPYAPPRSPWWP